MTKEKQVPINVHTPFILRLSDGTEQEFSRGQHTVPETVARHWFTRGNAEISASAAADSNDNHLAETADLKKQTADLTAQIAARDNTIRDLTAQTDTLNQQIAELTAGGAGHVKKSKSADGK